MKSTFLRSTLLLSLTGSLPAALPASAQSSQGAPSTPHIVVKPDWEKKPDPTETMKAWPGAATKGGINEGRAVIRCVVQASGMMDNCSVVSEEPAGFDFGLAALSLVPSMRMKPQTVDGQPVSGANVTIPFNFKRPTAPTPTKFDTPPEWLKKPTFDQLMAVYPRAAGQKGEGGKAVIRCIVNTNGLLRNCTVVSETPPGLGFGQAAIVLAPTLLMKPALKDGKPVESPVTVPISFQTGGAPLTGPGVQNVMIMSGGVWSKAPSMTEIRAEIDKKVGDKFADGKVAFQCHLDRKTGKLSACTLANLSPGMAQFQGVARALIPKFQADPATLTNIKDDIRLNLAFAFPDMSSSAWDKRYLAHPQWIRTISQEPQRTFPQEAAKAGLKTGTATVDCMVGADGGLGQCQVISESTPGLGFGDVAKKIAEAFAVNPWTDEGLPADGAHVLMPIRMNYDPPADPPADPPTAPTPATKP